MAIDYQRKWNQESASDDSSFINLVAKSGLPETEVESIELRKLLLHALSKLKKDHRDVIMCREIVGMNTEETAQVLGWTENKVRVSLHRVLRAARDYIVKEGDLSNG